MCTTCGCGSDNAPVISTPDHHHDVGTGHAHTHDDVHTHGHDHGHGGSATETITLERKVLAKNDELAQRNREWLTGRGIVALNVTSSPGAGKTTLLERTIATGPVQRVAVIEGDQETLLDAERIKATGAPVVQVNTGAGCHLDATMMHRALEQLNPAPGTLLFVENVGNLVCPALFDLGERMKVVVISVTEGTDKPLKYPHMFSAAGLVIINKIDLLPYVDFDIRLCRKYTQSINPDIGVLPLSVTTGEGMDEWYEWLRAQMHIDGM